MKRKPLPLYECKVLGTDSTGIFAMSFVDVPANESNFVALKANAIPVKLHTNKMKQILTGAVLIPNQVIYRNDSNGEYNIRFTAEDIEKIRTKMMRTGIALSTTTHQHEQPLEGNYLIECWIVENPKCDKSVALGLGEMPKGTLMASYKITSPGYWRNQVLAGKVKGFSLEGFFNFKNVNMKKPVIPAAKLAAPKGGKPNVLSAFLKGMAALLEGDTAADAKALADVAKDDETDSGTPYLVFELADGSELEVDAEGAGTIDGEPAPPGSHALADGNFIEIDDSGNMVVTTDATDTPHPAEAAAALAAAKDRGKQYLAALGKADAGKDGKGAKKPVTPNAKKIAELEAQIAELKKTPSAPKAKAGAPGKADAVDMEKLTPTERIAHSLTMARQRAKGELND